MATGAPRNSPAQRARRGAQEGAGIALAFQGNSRVGEAVARSPQLTAVLTLLALRVEREARKNAPVDTGRLRASITHRVYPEGTTKVVAEVGTNVAYAAAQEFGTRHGVPATRYMGRALQTVVQQLTR